LVSLLYNLFMSDSLIIQGRELSELQIEEIQKLLKSHPDWNRWKLSRYLSYRGSVGENLQYLVPDRFSRPVSCVLFGAAAWKVSCRDKFIGWDAQTQSRNVNLTTNNMRFLILPWVRVKNLASHIMKSGIV
jgi:hypothetical protein